MRTLLITGSAGCGKTVLLHTWLAGLVDAPTGVGVSVPEIHLLTGIPDAMDFVGIPRVAEVTVAGADVLQERLTEVARLPQEPAVVRVVVVTEPRTVDYGHSREYAEALRALDERDDVALVIEDGGLRNPADVERRWGVRAACWVHPDQEDTRPRGYRMVIDRPDTTGGFRRTGWVTAPDTTNADAEGHAAFEQWATATRRGSGKPGDR